jgi:hypothetical protein
VAIATFLPAGIDERLSSLMLDSIVVTYRSIPESKPSRLALAWFLHGVVKHFDLPSLVGALVPRPCCVLNATHAKGELLPKLKLSAIYRRALEIYTHRGASKGLNL